MTTLDDRARAMNAERAAAEEDFWADLMPAAAQQVVESGYASANRLGQRMIVGHDLADTLLFELHELGVVGPKHPDGSRDVFKTDTDLPGILAEIAAIAGDEATADDPDAEPANPEPIDLDDPPPSSPTVDAEATNQAGEHLADTDSNPGDTTVGAPGGDLVVRPDDNLAWPTTPPPNLAAGYLAPRQPKTLVVRRIRQAANRQAVWVADQPAVARTMAVGKQLPRASYRLAAGTPRGLRRSVAAAADGLFARRSAALVARQADTDHPDWHKNVAAHDKLRDNATRRRWLAAFLASLGLMVGLAWWAPSAFAAVLAATTFLTVLGISRGVCRQPKELAWCVVVALVLAWLAWQNGPDLAARLPHPPGWVWLVVGGLAVIGFGWVGRNDKPIMEMPARTTYKPPDITAPMIVEALFRIGVAGMTVTAADKGMRDEVRVRAPGVARAKNGYIIELELPPGITAGDVGEKREELAGALRRPLGCVWPSGGGDHPGHLRIYIGDKPMATALQTEWPLAVGYRIDLFNPFPLVTDEEGRWVDVTLIGTHAVVAGASGFGKSVTLRQLAVACSLDPRVRLYVFDGKISGDLAPLQKVAHGYYEGAEPEDVAEQLAALQGIEQEMRRRARFLRNLPPEERSPKVTSALASKYPHLSPIALLIDEVQEYTEYGVKGSKEDKAVRDQFNASLTRISRLGRSAGIAMVLVSQKPEASVISTAIMGNCAIRICHKVTEQNHNDQVLGTSAYKNGYNAALFSQEDKGLAWLRAEGDPRVVRSWSVMKDLDPAIELVDKAWAMRRQLGLLTGQAANDGIEDVEVVYSIAEDTEAVMQRHGCGAAQWEELLPWLRELRAQYAALTKEELSAGIRSAGVRSRDVRRDGVTRKGVYISDLRKRDRDDDE